MTCDLQTTVGRFSSISSHVTPLAVTMTMTMHFEHPTTQSSQPPLLQRAQTYCTGEIATRVAVAVAAATVVHRRREPIDVDWRSDCYGCYHALVIVHSFENCAPAAKVPDLQALGEVADCCWVSCSRFEDWEILVSEVVFDG
jgi:hypothetical protein